ncbi:anti-sigma factor family protein [Streptomyces sp. 8N706]|uniref:anti-sigma factor family protein n=1 Tax=Streptomyces sp. 8N706 TaxID=3457416 RepID=UPI003FD68136
MTASGGASHAEQHLGDRLAALVDGELGHEARERVLAHLATCSTCKAEADAQRQLKSVFAETAPPPPSEGLLARLQGLPGGDGGQGSPFGSGPGLGGGALGGPQNFSYVPSRGHGGADESGFRIHDVERSASRGRRFAFAAAGAVSLAAFALGGALPLEAAVDVSGGRGESAPTPVRTAPAGGAASVSGGDALLAASAAGGHHFPLVAPTGVRGPSSPAPTTHPSIPLLPYTSPLLPTAPALSPLIRPVAAGHQGTPFGTAFAGTAPARPAASSTSPEGAAPVVAATAPDAQASAGH